IKEDTKEKVKDEDKDEESTRKRKLGTRKKKYPLKKEILVQMLNLRLESEEESTMALELIRFIKKFAKNYKSNDPSLSRDYTLESGEDSLKLIELMDLCIKLIDNVTILENASKETHAQTLTMLMKKVKRLEDKLKFSNTRKKERMVISDA
ncbi:hypothetical protein Tco_0993603, partial [Tanacetum coccineum]